MNRSFLIVVAAVALSGATLNEVRADHDCVVPAAVRMHDSAQGLERTLRHCHGSQLLLPYAQLVARQSCVVLDQLEDGAQLSVVRAHQRLLCHYMTAFERMLAHDHSTHHDPHVLRAWQAVEVAHAELELALEQVGRVPAPFRQPYQLQPSPVHPQSYLRPQIPQAPAPWSPYDQVGPGAPYDLGIDPLSYRRQQMIQGVLSRLR